MSRDSWIAYSVKKPTIIFVLCLVVALFYYVGNSINVYKFAWLGAVFEILSIPMLIALFALPVFSFVLLVKNKFKPASLYLYSFIISLVTLLVLITSK